MQDEYSAITNEGTAFVIPELELECGDTLYDAEIRYCTWGTLDASRSNVLVICHALTGNADLESWWPELLGPGKPFDTDKYLVFCANILGSCYGSTGPTSINPKTGKKYGAAFPPVTVRDTVAAHRQAVEKGVGANKVRCVIGGSLGGMQALEWATMNEFVLSALPIACGAYHHGWQIAISELQRQALYSDPLWRGGDYSEDEPPSKGLALARMIAMVSYRTDVAFNSKFGRKADDGEGSSFVPVISTSPAPRTPPSPGLGRFSAKSYLEYQGLKFLSRMDPMSYKIITEQMDSHDLGRNRGGFQSALKAITIPMLVLAINSDILYPPHEQEEVAALVPHAALEVIDSPDGHDGFLLAQADISAAVIKFLNSDSVVEAGRLKAAL